MLDKRRLVAQPDEKREELFTQRYERLLVWALRLTNQQRESAEDLVQDAFVQFMLGRTKLEEIENIDGYLRRMLRYMHLARMSRRAQHLRDTALSIADYDSFRLSWSAIEPPRRMQAAEELRQICAYACARKESSRAGSVLILRFFHDYLPTEIANILSSSRHCVDQWQRLARREVKLFIDEPNRLRFVASKSSAELRQIRYSGSDCDLMAELRRIIFSSCHGECLSTDHLREVYNSANAEALTTSRLAHIVSCPECLDAVNRLLGLPLLAARYEAEPRDRPEPPHDGTGGGGGASGVSMKFERRLREVGEHKPHELRIAVNGTLVSSLKVTSDVTELDLNLAPDQRIQFVEVFSEQGVQLLFLSVNDAVVSEPEQWACIALSEGRTLEACLSLQNGPSLRVVYKEPASEEVSYITETLEVNAPSSPFSIVHVPVGSNGIATPGAESVRCWVDRFIGVFRVQRQRLFSYEETPEAQDPEVSCLTLSAQAPKASRARRWMRPELVTALVSAAIIAAFLFYKASLAPTLTATTLLERASAAEQIGSRIPDQISHRYINLEERRSTEGAVVSRRKIEIWENHPRGERAQRLYDENNRLVSGTWQRANGARTVYHHGVELHTQAAPPMIDSLLLNPEDIWQLEPSAKVFRALIGEAAAADVEQKATSYVISYERGRAIGASRLLKATLTLSRSDLHPIEQTLAVERAGELREYRFVEASFERLPTKAVAPAVFEVEPDLVGGDGGAGRPGNGAHRDLTSTRVPPFLMNSATASASAELEVDVAYLLNQAKADRNEQISLARTGSGLLRVEGVVDNQERKQELLRALAPVSNNPAVTIEITTVTEALQRQTRTSSARVTIRDAEDTANTLAVDSELRDYFSKGSKAASATDGLDEAVRSFSSRMVNRAYRTLFHAIELKRLVNRFANVDMRTVTPDARAKWLEMLRQHVAAFERESGLLRQEIQPVFFSGASSNVADENVIVSDAELARAVERLHSLALSNNQAIRSTFTISSQSSSAVKSSQFWRSLASAEKLAARIRQYGE